MRQRMWIVFFLFLFVSLTDAAVTITPVAPSKLDSCYQISSAEELYGFAAIVNGNMPSMEKDTTACGKLTKDIVVNENVLDENGNLNVADTASFAQWTPIMKFRGKFNGNSHKISGLYIDTKEPRYVGLFGLIRPSIDDGIVDIRNLGIEGSFFRAGDYVGAFVGFIEGGSVVNIENCYSHSRIESHGFAVGGFVGYSLANVQLKTVHNLGPVMGARFIGGLVGYLNGQNLKIINAYNMGAITSVAEDPDDSYDVGGLVGYINADDELLVENCFNMGPITAAYTLGGIVGSLTGTNLLMKTVFNEGTIKSFDDYTDFTYVGGLIGYSGGILTFQNSYNVGSVSGYKGVGGIIGLNYSTYVAMTNVYNAGTVLMVDSDVSYLDPIMWNPVKNNEVHFENTFYLDANYGSAKFGIPVTSEQLEDGSIAYLMHYSIFDSVDATVWGQNVGNDMYPNFSGVVTDVSLSSLETLALHTYEGDTTALPEKYLPGFEFKLPEVDKEEEIFAGWYDNAEFSGNPVSAIPSTAEGTQEFWAKFIGNRQVTFETNGGTIDSGLIETYMEGDVVILPYKVSRSGYIFNGWFKDENFSGDRLFKIGPDDFGDKVFYAKWFKKETPTKDENGCYVIKNAEELYGFAAIVNGTDGYKSETWACASLANNIVVNENVLNAEGHLNEDAVQGFIEWDPIVDFAGTFDGNMYSISGLYIRTDEWENSPLWGFGLFSSISGGSLENPVVIANLGVVDSYFEAPYNVGALIGYVNTGKNSLYDSYLAVINCYSTSSVTAKNYGGGILGKVSKYNVVVVENSYNSGIITGNDYYVGGILGRADNGSEVYIENCFNVGGAYRYESGLGYPLVGDDNEKAEVINSYYLQSADNYIEKGIMATSEQFANGSVALALHYGSSGSIWGQEVGVDPLPNYSGIIKNSTIARYNVSFYTYVGDRTNYFSSYVEGLPKALPDSVVREGYTFSGWYADSNYSGSPIDSILSSDEGDLEFYAKLTPILYKVVVSASPATWGDVVNTSKRDLFQYGDTVELMAVPAPGYEFDCWKDDMNNTDPVRTYVVTEPKAFVAYFKLGTLSSSSTSSSSSAKSSSSSATSSSSIAESSSSEEIVSTSSSSYVADMPKSKSNSSVAPFLPITFEISCSGKKCSDALPVDAMIRQFQVKVVGREIQVTEAYVGRHYALFDMQGHLLRTGYVLTPNFTIPVNQSGSYLVRIGNWTKRVTVR